MHFSKRNRWPQLVLSILFAVCIGQLLTYAINGHFSLDTLIGAPLCLGFLRTKFAPSPNAVASGKTATINLDVGRRYHSITLVFGYDAANASKETAGTLANQVVNDIRVKINGKTQRLFSAKQLNAMNIANGDASSPFQLRTSGTMGSTGYREYLTIYFAEPWRKDIDEQVLTAWNMHPDDAKTFQIEVDFGTITTPFLDCFYTFDALTGRLGGIEKVIRQTVATAGTQIDVTTIQRPVTDFLQAIHIFAAGDGHYVNKAKLTINGEDVQDPVDYLYQRAKLLAWGMNPDTNANSTTNYLSPRFDLIVDYDDPVTSAIPFAQVSSMNLNLQFDAATASTMDLLIVRSGPPD